MDSVYKVIEDPSKCRLKLSKEELYLNCTGWSNHKLQHAIAKKHVKVMMKNFTLPYVIKLQIYY